MAGSEEPGGRSRPLRAWRGRDARRLAGSAGSVPTAGVAAPAARVPFLPELLGVRGGGGGGGRGGGGGGGYRGGGGWRGRGGGGGAGGAGAERSGGDGRPGGRVGAGGLHDRRRSPEEPATQGAEVPARGRRKGDAGRPRAGGGGHALPRRAGGIGGAGGNRRPGRGSGSPGELAHRRAGRAERDLRGGGRGGAGAEALLPVGAPIRARPRGARDGRSAGRHRAAVPRGPVS